MCAERGGLDITEQEAISHSRVQSGEGGVWESVMAGWPTHGGDCVMYPSMLESERYVQDMTARSQ